MYTLIIKTIFLICLVIASFGSGVSVYGKDESLCRFQQTILTNANQLYQREQYLLSSTQYSLLFSSECNRLASKARYNYALAMMNLGENEEILEQYRYFKENNFSDAESEKVKVLIQLSSQDMTNINVKIWNSLDEADTRPLLANLNNDAALEHDEYLLKRNTKSPFIAGFLSALVPGAGQVYNGTYQSAAVSFLLNSIFLLSTVEFAKEDLVGPAIASGMVFSVTYIGNIMNAVRSSNTINDKSSSVSRQRIKGFLFPILKLEY